MTQADPIIPIIGLIIDGLYCLWYTRAALFHAYLAAKDLTTHKYESKVREEALLNQNKRNNQVAPKRMFEVVRSRNNKLQLVGVLGSEKSEVFSERGSLEVQIFKNHQGSSESLLQFMQRASSRQGLRRVDSCIDNFSNSRMPSASQRPPRTDLTLQSSLK